jgi:NAD(P)-dependent dehydrogenase (short-subunit alcohol dehydrogenase family)
VPADRVAIVTGAASGIGRATALLFVEHGQQVVAVDRDCEGVHRTAAVAATDRLLAHVADVTDPAAVEGMVRATVDRFGRVDVLVAAAAVSRSGPADRLQEQDWNAVVDVSLKGTWLCCRAVLPELRRSGGGAIVTFGSVIGRAAIAGTGAYAAAKAGIEALTRVLAVDHAHEGIRANSLVPGSTDTPMMWAGLREDEIPAVRSQVESEVPMRRLADPSEIARAVYFLASNEASFITGASLVVDGGTLAKLAQSY